jgi:uncharacterized oxidoreductase
VELSGQRVLITGGASGIGLGLARALKARGAHVVVCGRRQAVLDEATALGLDARRCDLADAAQVDALFAALHQDGPLDILVNNAAVSAAPQLVVRDWLTGGPVVDSADVHHELVTNAGGSILATQHFLRGRGDRQGVLVFVSSPVIFGPAVAPLYAASKAAQHAWCRSVRYGLRGSPVRVVEVMPPAVDTALNALPGGNKADAGEVGEAIARGLARGQEVIVVGPVWLVRGAARLSPRLAMALVAWGSEATGSTGPQAPKP